MAKLTTAVSFAIFSFCFFPFIKKKRQLVKRSVVFFLSLHKLQKEIINLKNKLMYENKNHHAV